MPSIEKYSKAKPALLLLIKKDISLFFLRGGGFGQAILLGLLLIFVFSLSLEIGERASGREIGTLFWLASVFCMVLICNNLHALEEHNGVKTSLHLMPQSVLFVWLSKSISALVFMLIAQICFFFALLVFCNAQFMGAVSELLTICLLVDIGMVSCGALLGSLAVGNTGKESLLSIVLFPLLTPLLLAGIEIFAVFFTLGSGDFGSWHWIMLSFDAVFLALSLILFPFIYVAE